MTCASLQTYAETVQDALDATQALIDDRLNPPAVWVRRSFSAGQAISAGVTLVLSYAEVMYDTDTMFNLVAPTLITIFSPGTYLVNLESNIGAVPATLTSYRIAILVNGAEVAYYKSDAGTGTNSASQPIFVSAMPISLVPGDNITTTALFTGTGAGTNSHYLSVMRISTT